MATEPSRTDTVGKIKIKIRQQRSLLRKGGYSWVVLHPLNPRLNASFNTWQRAYEYAEFLVRRMYVHPR